MIEQREQPTSSIYERFPELKEVDPLRLPKHIAIIPDGNRRYFEEQGGDITNPTGLYLAGVKKTHELTSDLFQINGIEEVTYWAGSVSNFDKRSKEEINELSKTIAEGLPYYLPQLLGKNGRFLHIGRKDRFIPELREAILEAELSTCNNKGKRFNLALDYSGNDQDVRIDQQIVNLVLSGVITDASQITQHFREILRDGGGKVKPADLILRTSQERTSGIGWLEGEETEIRFFKKLYYPQLTTDDVVEALLDFSQTERRMGR